MKRGKVANAPDSPIAMPVDRVFKEHVNSLVSKLLLVALQILIGVSIYQLITNMVLPGLSAAHSHLLTSIFGCGLAIMSTYFILCKYQTMVQCFSQENDKLWHKVDERTIELTKANEDLKQEIAERKRMEEVLSESEARFRTVIHEANIGIALIDRDGYLMECNPALQIMLGYRPEELRGLVFSKVIHSHDAGLIDKLLQDLSNGLRSVNCPGQRFIRKDGWEGWCSLSLSLVRDYQGHPKFYIAMVEDITIRQEAEEQIQGYQKKLQSLASELVLTEERERKELAMGLHDHIGQTLALANIKLLDLLESPPYPDIVPTMEEILTLIEQSIKYSRSLMFELSPPILYDLGYEATVEWLVEHMRHQYDLLIELENDGQPKPLTDNRSILLFRSVRELLFNIIKHARASTAKVSLKRVGDKLQAIVTDDGVGFDLNKTTSQAGNVQGFGLFSIKERLDYFGGSLEIESALGQGTRVTLLIPVTTKRSKPLPRSSAVTLSTLSSAENSMFSLTKTVGLPAVGQPCNLHIKKNLKEKTHGYKSLNSR